MSVNRKKKSFETRAKNKIKKAQAFLNLIKSQNEVSDISDRGECSQKGRATLRKRKKKKMSEQNDTTNAATGEEPPRKKIKVHMIDLSSNDEAAQCKKAKETDEVLLEMRRALKERQKAIMQRPKVFLSLDELTRDSPHVDQDGVKEAPPLVMLDVQHLLLFALMGTKTSIKPRWLRLLRPTKLSKVVAIVVDSVSSAELEMFPDCLPTLRQAFDFGANLISPKQYGSTVREDLTDVQISRNRLRRQLIENSGEDAEESKEELVSPDAKQNEVKEQEMSEGQAEQEQELQESLDKFDRRSLMLSTSQILHEGIPLPYGLKQYESRGFLFSKDSYTDVTSTSPMFAVDCEMVQSTASGMDLARISIVNEHLETVYDSFVKPRARITNYVTRFSGITKEIMNGCHTYLEDIQEHIRNFLPSDAILCGQSIGSDLKSMKIFHPYLIDTSVIFNLTGKRRMKTSLKRLSAHFLNQDIQFSADGHSSVEDAKATMELVKLKLMTGIEFGDLAWEGEIPCQYYSNRDTTNIDSQTGNMHRSDTHIENTTNIDSQKGNMHRSDTHIENTTNIDSQKGNMRRSDTHVENTTNIDSQKGNMRRSDTHIENTTNIDSQRGNTHRSDTHIENMKLDGSSGKSNLESSMCMSNNSGKTCSKRKLFFRPLGRRTEFILKHIKLCDRRGVVFDEPNEMKHYPEGENVLCEDSDDQRLKRTVACLQENDFCLTYLYGYRDLLSSSQCKTYTVEQTTEKKKRCLQRLDKKIGEIMTEIPANSLYVVILSGYPDRFAKVFCKITNGLVET